MNRICQLKNCGKKAEHFIELKKTGYFLCAEHAKELGKKIMALGNVKKTVTPEVTVYENADKPIEKSERGRGRK